VDLAALRESPIGSLVPISGSDQRTGEHYDYFAYLPASLPGTLSLRSATWTAVTRAESALARLDQASRQIPTPALLRQPSLRREAQSTSALEGTFAPIEEVLESPIEDRAKAPVEMREILNYVVAAEEGFQWIAERPLTVNLLGNLQRLLVQGTPADFSDAGGLRDRQVLIGARGSAIQDARFVPPPPGDQLRAGVESWIAWVNDPPNDLPAVVLAALAHYQFETLHPFSDGNGRIGRLVIALQFMQRSVLREPILVVSPWFEARRERYQDGLLDLSRSGDWDVWVRFFAQGVEASADDTRDRVDALLEWQAATLLRARATGLSGVAERVAGELIGTPFLRAADVAARHGVSPQAAIKALRRLVDVDVLEERQRNGRVVFSAPTVVRLISR
jgi:Fic family protein